jgi:hypothetical protein
MVKHDMFIFKYLKYEFGALSKFPRLFAKKSKEADEAAKNGVKCNEKESPKSVA